MSSSNAAKEDVLEKPSGLARLEANANIMMRDPDFVFTKDEALDWLGQAIVWFESLSTTSQSADEILHHAVNVSQAAKLVEAFDGCQRSRCMLAEPFVKKAFEMVEQIQDVSKLQQLARRVAASAKLKCGAARLKAKYPTRKYEDRFKDKPSILHGPCQSFQDFSYTKEEAMERLACALVMFTTQSTLEDLLDRAVEVGQAAMLVNTFDLCDTTSSMLSHLKTQEAFALVKQHQEDANFNKLVERADRMAMIKAKAGRLTLRKGYYRHLFTELFVKKHPLCEEQLSSKEAEHPNAAGLAALDCSEKPSGLALLEANVKIMRSDPDFVLTKDEVLDWLGQAIVWFESLLTTSQSADEILYHAVDVSQAAKFAGTFALCERSSYMLSGLSTTKALLMVEQTQDLSKIKQLAGKAASLAILKAGTHRKHDDRVEAECPNLAGPSQSYQDFSFTKDEAMESLARAIVWFSTSPTTYSDDRLLLAVRISQALALVNTFDLCDTTSNMLSRHEIKEALAMVQQHQDDANFDKLFKRAEMEAKLKASADRICLRKGYHRHLFTDKFVKKQL